jgi:hypothetical protein
MTARIKELEREVREQRMENEFLGKSVAHAGDGCQAGVSPSLVMSSNRSFDGGAVLPGGSRNGAVDPLVAGPLLSGFPKAALGALVIFAAVRLIDVTPAPICQRRRRSRSRPRTGRGPAGAGMAPAVQPA